MLYGANRTLFKAQQRSIATRLPARQPHLSRRERKLLRLRHPHIAPLYLDRQQKVARIATEPMPGPTLADQLEWRRSTPFGLPEVLEVLTPVAQALEYAHKRGVAHGHLHPSVIVQMPEGAIVTGFTEPTPGRADAYRAPEAVAGVATPSGDVYALALLSYEMLTGTLPNMVASARRRLPPGVDAALARALAHNPRDRYQSPLNLLAALQAPPEYPSHFSAVRDKVRRDGQNMVIAMFSFVAILLIAAVLLGAIVGTQF